MHLISISRKIIWAPKVWYRKASTKSRESNEKASKIIKCQKRFTKKKGTIGILTVQ